MLIDAFPILAAGSRSAENRRIDLDTPEQVTGRLMRVERALQEIAEGVAAGAIRNVVLQEAKFTLGNAVERAWQEHVKAPFFYGRGNDNPEDLNALYWSFSVSNTHDVLAAAKKVAKTTVTGPAVEAMKAFMAEMLPLAEQMKALKDKVVMGRAPASGPAKAENPNKTVRTCSCCRRGIATAGASNMAAHGYQRPGQGSQTASCAGVDFGAFEISNAGLLWLHERYARQISTARTALATRHSLKALTTTQRGPNGREQLVTVRPGEPGWPQVFRAHVSRLKAELDSTEHALLCISEDLANWVQIEIAPGVPVASELHDPAVDEIEEPDRDMIEGPRP